MEESGKKINQTKKLVAVNTLSQLAAKAVSSVAMFVLTILIARSYGPAGYGEFTKITTYIAFFYLFADFGLNAVFVREQTHENHQDSTRLLQTLVALRISLSAFLVFVAVALAAFLPSTANGQGYQAITKLGIILYSPTIIFQAMVTTANAVFQKQLRYDRATAAVFFGSLVAVFLVFVSTRIFLSNIAIYAILAGLTTGVFINAWLAVKMAGISPAQIINVTKSDMTHMLLRALPLGLTLISNVIYFRADSFILTVTRSTQEVGLYGLAYKIFEIPLVLPTFFMNSLFPILSKMAGNRHPDNDIAFRRLFIKSCTVLSISGIFVSVGLWILAPFIALVRADFAASIPAFRILILGIPVFFITSVSMWGMVALKMQQSLLAIYASCMVLNILANMVIIPKYGYLGAAWVTVLSETCVFMLSVFVLQKSKKLFIRSQI